MDALIQSIAREIQALALSMFASYSYRKTYRLVLTHLLSEPSKMQGTDEEFGKLIDRAHLAAKHENDQSVALVQESLDRMLELVAKLTKAQADLDEAAN